MGENFTISRAAWCRFTTALPSTNVAYLYVSECHLIKSNIKAEMRAAIRANRMRAPPRDPEVVSKITHMWFNPKPPMWWTLEQEGFLEASAKLRGLTGKLIKKPKCAERDGYLEMLRGYSREWMLDKNRGMFAPPSRPRELQLPKYFRQPLAVPKPLKKVQFKR